VQTLLRFSRLVDALNERVGRTIYWLVLIAVLISAGNAIVRYALNTSSNAWLEVQWYSFSAIFLLCAGYTLLRNEHIRIDIIAGRFSRRTQTWIDIVGGLFFLLPMAVIIGWLSWPMVVDSYVRHEMSTDAGGLIRWPVKVLIPIGFALLVLQGLSELIKRFGFLKGACPDPSARFHAHGSHPDEEAVKQEVSSATGEDKP
jgi:TRAP-type mannitol/chloroaromatic compound transport system permease small subunit